MFPFSTYPGGGTPPVNPTDAGGAAHAAHHASSATLPFTGGDVLTLVVLGVLLVVVGLMFLYTRKHNTTEPVV